MSRAFALLELVQASAPCLSNALIRYDSRVTIEVAHLVRHNQPLGHQPPRLGFCWRKRINKDSSTKSRSSNMEKVAYNEVELAKRWGISPKTLQRWRSEGRGPRYLKLSKRVVYPVDEIEAYEHDALYTSTWQKADDVIPPSSAQWMSARQTAYATGMPM
jgi:predicted DNA-binding transcriptional regulator AlpA